MRMVNRRAGSSRSTSVPIPSARSWPASCGPRSSAPSANSRRSRRSSSDCAITKIVRSKKSPSSWDYDREPCVRIFSGPFTRFDKSSPNGSPRERKTPMKHFSEADLLETYYLQPSEASPIIEHVNGCNACQDRYRRLAQKLRDMAACSAEKPATFWTRQRLMIMRTVDNARERSQRGARTMRVAAAALLAFVLGGAVVYKSVEPALKRPPVIVTQQTAVAAQPADDLQIPRDPWQSDELKDFGN